MVSFMHRLTNVASGKGRATSKSPLTGAVPMVDTQWKSASLPIRATWMALGG